MLLSYHPKAVLQLIPEPSCVIISVLQLTYELFKA
uniref:Uncharacterized protein n=1 Tax=Arundo donax TaxID=35708 RepID=A0A0A9GK91_ARUDO